ncbi:MAG: DUF4335 domain-containing protein [Acaryochloridaceae cyanobacterium RU_4_10]|nr:DUF4335 domain-containing protein [Acaryochloridaceae cyanobacterium RU_4_10]
MTIQRQYSLPNCVLILEGLSNAPEASAGGNRPELNILTRFECYFAREKQALIGGRDLLEGLLQATNRCVQSWISGMQPLPYKGKEVKPEVQLQPLKEGGFDLVVPGVFLAQGSSEDANLEQPVAQFHISSVQLFDLMEAIDQLAADQQTLPDLQADIRPRSRQEVRSGSSTLEQSAPLALGVTSVGVAAAALFFMPVPKVPTPPKESQQAPASLGQPLVEPPTKSSGDSKPNTVQPLTPATPSAGIQPSPSKAVSPSPSIKSLPSPSSPSPVKP